MPEEETRGGSEKLFEERWRNIISWLSKNKKWLIYVALAIIIILGFQFRLNPLQNLKDVTTGKYITLELDSTLWLRYAKIILEQGSLPQIDSMRFVPQGLDLTYLGTFTSYFVVFTYQVLKLFVPSMTIELADLLYPPIATAIASIFFFLLVRRLVDWRIALLSTAVLTVQPSFLYRSISSDHDILVMMLTMMALYFFFSATHAKKITHLIAFGILAALATGLGRLSGGAINVVFMVIGTFIFFELLFNKLSEKDYYAFASWIIPYTLLIFTSPKFLNFSSYFSSILTGGIAYISFMIATIDFVVFKKNVFSVRKYFEKIKLPEGITATITAALLGFLIMPRFFLNIGTELLTSFFRTAETTSRWALTVAESREPYVVEWFGSFGSRMYVYLFILGSIILFITAFKDMKKIKYLPYVYIPFILGYIFSKYAQFQRFDGENAISRFTFFSALAILIVPFAYTYIRSFYKDKELYNEFRLLSKERLFLIIWFLIMIVSAKVYIRLLFEFTPITAVLFAAAIIYIFDRLSSIKWSLAKPVACLLLFIFLLNPFSFAQGYLYKNYIDASSSTKYMGPGFNAQWQFAGKWARENTPKDAVFAHWWDYGYWVQEGFERATMTDGGNLGGYALNHFMGRYVLTGQNESEALPFLKAHNANYLLILNDEIGKFAAYSSIGSDEHYDRYSYIPVFQLDPAQSRETRNETMAVYTGGFSLDENFVFEDKLFPRRSAGIGAFIVPVQQIEGTSGMKQPLAVLVSGSNQLQLPIQCIVVNGTANYYEKYAMPGCLTFIPRFESDNRGNPFGAALWLSRKVANTNFARLYLWDQPGKYFKKVYDDNIPLSIYQGRLIGPIRIWEIKYPPNVEIPEHILKNELPNPAVTIVTEKF